jgi:CRP-like cAMP-binding protein
MRRLPITFGAKQQLFANPSLPVCMTAVDQFAPGLGIVPVCGADLRCRMKLASGIFFMPLVCLGHRLFISKQLGVIRTLANTAKSVRYRTDRIRLQAYKVRMDKLINVKKNHLLATLTDEDLHQWLPHLEPVDLPLGHVLYEVGTTLGHIYFPTTAIVSLLYVMHNGDSAEIAVVGNDGLVGISLIMGGGSTPSRALVQNGGKGFRIEAELVQKKFENSKHVLHLFLRYTQALITQMTQSAACNKHHSLDQQLCRWLLLTLDRYEGNELNMTKQLIANMLGTSGEIMRQGAKNLEKAGLIHYAKGKVTVLDREGLEKRSCECYRIVKAEYDRLLPQIPTT